MRLFWQELIPGHWIAETAKGTYYVTDWGNFVEYVFTTSDKRFYTRSVLDAKNKCQAHAL